MCIFLFCRIHGDFETHKLNIEKQYRFNITFNWRLSAMAVTDKINDRMFHATAELAFEWNQ